MLLLLIFLIEIKLLKIGYIILILKDGKYYSFGDDKRILDYIGFNNKLSILKKKSINFIVLDDLEILGYAKYEINNLYKYLCLSYISDILYKIKRSLINE